MFSIFDYLRRLVRDSVLAGVQDAFEIMDQGDHREAIAVAARDFLNRGLPELPPPPPALPPSQPARPKPESTTSSTTPAPADSIADLLPSSITLPAQVPPRVEGYDKYERRKKGSNRPQQPQRPQGPAR